ncbi:MAG: hypothetical protein PHU54_02690 [Candidatus Omnitrophica bacterium]|nr:hypothetical protein [Candidatus Omnitrophota bacterium]
MEIKNIEELTNNVLLSAQFSNDNYLNYQYISIPFETVITTVAGTAVAVDVSFSNNLKDILLIDTLRGYVVNSTTFLCKAEDPLFVTLKVEIGDTNFRIPTFPSLTSLWRMYDIIGNPLSQREKYDLKHPWIVPAGSQVTVTFTTAGAGLTAGQNYLCGIVMTGTKIGNELYDKLSKMPKVV